MRKCARCGKALDGRGARARYCSSTCRARASDARRKGDAPAPPPVLAVAQTGPMLTATRNELAGAGRLDTSSGAAAVALAERIDRAAHDTGSAYAALVREWRATMAQAMDGVALAADPLDELRVRRERRRA